jgi:DNA end-binding protein Ku
MAARAIASGTISFGLVSVPVKLFSGTQAKSLHFNLLHEKDKSRLRQQYVCAGCNEVVERDAMVKGYEYAKDQYAILTDEELKALEQQSDQSIEIEEFVPIGKVDPIYFDKAYLLGPDKGGNKAYLLLREAMERAGRGALARFSTRGKQQLVLLRQARGGIMMHTLFYADEVRSFDDIELTDGVAFKGNEIDLAVQLIEQLASKSFEPEKYEDQYRKSALEMIEQKVAGQEIAVAPARPAKGQIIDLMQALKASLEAKKKGPAAGEEAARKPAQVKGQAAGRKKAAGKAK